MKVAVVGAGIMGSSAAWSLAQRGHEVHLFDHHDLSNERGSSHGRSRIVRRAYPDPYFTSLMTEAYPLWNKLDELAGGGILHEVGLLYIGQHDSPNVQSMTQGLADQGVTFTVLDHQGEKCPFIREPGEVGVHVKEGGWVHAAKAIKALNELAFAKGVTFSTSTFAPGMEREYDYVVLTVGSWIKNWIPELPVRVSKQTFSYVPAQYQKGPVWIMDGELGTYGFPPEPGTNLVKIGIHRRGPEIDPKEKGLREPEEADLEEIRSFVRLRLGIENPELVEPKTCLYTSTVDEDFKWGWLDRKTIFASPCSGHGFKFGPWVGERLADFVDGSRQVSDYPRFAFPV